MDGTCMGEEAARAFGNDATEVLSKIDTTNSLLGGTVICKARLGRNRLRGLGLARICGISALLGLAALSQPARAQMIPPGGSGGGEAKGARPGASVTPTLGPDGRLKGLAPNQAPVKAAPVLPMPCPTEVLSTWENHGIGTFSKDGQTLLFLASNGTPQDGEGVASQGSGAIRHRLYRLSLSSGTLQSLLAVKLPGDYTLITHGDPPAGLTIVAFDKPLGDCVHGQAAAVTMVMPTPQAETQGAKTLQPQPAQAPMREKGDFMRVGGTTFPYLVDVARRGVVEFDLDTMQRRVGYPIPDGEVPLFVNIGALRYISWRPKEPRALRAYQDRHKTHERQWILAPSERPIVHGEQAAIARLDPGTNSLKIIESKVFTKTDKPGQFKVALPSAYPVNEAAIEAHFGRRLAVVFGNPTVTRRKWRRAFLIGYGKAQTISTVSLENNEYVSDAAIDPAGSTVVFFIKDPKTERHSAIKVFQVASENWREIRLPE